LFELRLFFQPVAGGADVLRKQRFGSRWVENLLRLLRSQHRNGQGSGCLAEDTVGGRLICGVCSRASLLLVRTILDIQDHGGDGQRSLRATVVAG
jgi:hypothetical protein